MSLAEVKESIIKMTIEQRLEIAALLKHLERADDPAYQGELDRRMAAMDSGHKTDQEALHRLHRELSAKGK